jgi:hypothetical protein
VNCVCYQSIRCRYRYWWGLEKVTNFYNGIWIPVTGTNTGTRTNCGGYKFILLPVFTVPVPVPEGSHKNQYWCMDITLPVPGKMNYRWDVQNSTDTSFYDIGTGTGMELVIIYC